MQTQILTVCIMVLLVVIKNTSCVIADILIYKEEGS